MNRVLMTAMAATVVACGAKKDASEGATPPSGNTGVTSSRPALVYRTGTDHKDHVPVLLSDDRQRIISYPHPKDLRSAAGYPAPTPLAKGYLLDNRGIGLNVAYLGITYEQYAALEDAPTLAALDSMIIDRDPLLELCDCGSRSDFKDLVTDLNGLLQNETLDKRCERLK